MTDQSVNKELVEFRLHKIEESIGKMAEDVSQIKSDVAVNRTKTTLMGTVGGAVVGVPAAVLAWIRSGGV